MNSASRFAQRRATDPSMRFAAGPVKWVDSMLRHKARDPPTSVASLRMLAHWPVFVRLVVLPQQADWWNLNSILAPIDLSMRVSAGCRLGQAGRPNCLAWWYAQCP